MQPVKIAWFDRFKRIFRNKLKPFLVEGKYKVDPAFSLDGIDYFYYSDPKEIPAGRFFAAMGIYKEMECNADKDFILSYTKAIEKCLNPLPGKPINLTWIAQMNINLRERLELDPMPEYIYKLASVVFFDKSESLYSYDYEYNKLKIERWKVAGRGLDFFSKTYLRELIPCLNMPDKDIQTYSTVKSMVHEVHQALVTEILSENH